MFGGVDSKLSGASSLTPWGAGLGVVADAISTPNTSAATAGDFFAGSQTFGVGIQTGGSSGSLPAWLLVAAVALAAFYILRRK